MSTYLRLLMAVFWTLPVQRLCTLLGLGVLVMFEVTLSAPSFRRLELLEWGLTLGLLLPALLGGPFWRALSAPRVVGLAPNGRRRLLLAAVGVVATIAATCVLFMFLTYVNLSRRYGYGYGMGPEFAYQNFAAPFAMATWWAIAFFIASRSPLAMLIVLATVIGSVLLLDKLGVENIALLLSHSWSIALPLVLWLVFGTWYIRTCRIRPPGWLLPGGQSIFASVATGNTAVVDLPRAAAMQRLLLDGSSLPRVLSQWLLVVGLLLAILLVLGSSGMGDPAIVAHVAFAALILCPVIVAAQSMAIVRRGRALWLPSGYSRGQLFAFIEYLLLKLAAGLSLVFCGFLLVLWFTQPWHPATTLMQALCVILVPSLLVASNALSRPRGRDFYWRWAAMMALCWFIGWKPLTATDPATWFGPRGWLWMAMILAVGVALRMLARLRWLVEDLPRATTSPSAAS